MNFVKLYHPKSKSYIMVNMDNVFYMKNAGGGFVEKTFIYTINREVIGVAETIDEIMNNRTPND